MRVTPGNDIPASGNLATTERVMVVDDDRHILVAVKTVLNDAGFPVEMAESGDECVLLLKQGFSGVILLDIMMPEMDGWDTIRAIHSGGLGGNVLIAMLTARDSPDEKMNGLQEYVFDYITKPFEPEELVSKVRLYSKYLRG
ncbi:MAG: response regulator transcription factor [Methanomicrobiales archaeon]|nr:response regulator transcription factor [Methanomicrobiales archaeon]